MKQLRYNFASNLLRIEFPSEWDAELVTAVTVGIKDRAGTALLAPAAATMYTQTDLDADAAQFAKSIFLAAGSDAVVPGNERWAFRTDLPRDRKGRSVGSGAGLDPYPRHRAHRQTEFQGMVEAEEMKSECRVKKAEWGSLEIPRFGTLSDIGLRTLNLANHV